MKNSLGWPKQGSSGSAFFYCCTYTFLVVVASPPRVGNSSSFLIVPCFFLGTKELELADMLLVLLACVDDPAPVVGNWKMFDPA
jgi:hypothetical protein